MLQFQSGEIGTLLSRDYTFKYLKTTFKCRITHKFNFVYGTKYKGKSWVIKQLIASGNRGEIQALYHMYHTIDFTKSYNCLWMIDECEFPEILHEVGATTLCNSPNVFLIVSRDIPIEIPVHYCAVYDWVSKNRQYTIRRHYKEHNQLPITHAYYCEDSKSGYQYYNSRLGSVVSLNGKDNISIMSTLNEDSTVIADGAAFARTLHILESSNSKVNLYLPDSFEGLVCEHIPSAKHIVNNAYSDEVLKYKSVERYYCDRIKEVLPNYSKRNCPDYIKNLDLLNTEQVYKSFIKRSLLAFKEKNNISDEDFYNVLQRYSCTVPNKYSKLPLEIKAYVALCLLNEINSDFFKEVKHWIQKEYLLETSCV